MVSALQLIGMLSFAVIVYTAAMHAVAPNQEGIDTVFFCLVISMCMLFATVCVLQYAMTTRCRGQVLRLACFLRLLPPEAAATADDIPAYKQPAAAAAAALSETEKTVCTVCLSDVVAGEMVKMLPACQHLFHQPCIDTWLLPNSTCPICRRDVFPPLPAEMV